MEQALVIGASSGIGRAVAEEWQARGAVVTGLSRAADGLDVTDPASVAGCFDAASERYRVPDLVFNNAGVGSYGIQELFSADEMHRVFDVNVYGVQRVMRAVLPHLRAQGSGTVVYTSSLIGRVAIEPERNPDLEPLDGDDDEAQPSGGDDELASFQL